MKPVLVKPVRCILGRHAWRAWVYEVHVASPRYNWARRCKRCGRYDFRSRDPR